jgi:hypothetical protein
MPSCHGGAPDTRIWTASTLIGIEPTSAQNRGYSRICHPSTGHALRSTLGRSSGRMNPGAYLRVLL